MKKHVTTNYYIELGELREIIATYFKEKTGIEVPLCNIDVKISNEQYCTPKFKHVVIDIQEDF